MKRQPLFLACLSLAVISVAAVQASGVATERSPQPAAAEASAAAASAPAPADDRLANTWVYQTLTFTMSDGSMMDASADVHGYIQFRRNGTYQQELRIGEFNNIYHGTYSVSGDRIRLTYTDGGETATETMRFGITGIRLSLTTEGAEPTFYGLQLDGTCHEGICARSGIRQP